MLTIDQIMMSKSQLHLQISGLVQKKLKELNIEPESASLQRIPKIFKKLDQDEFIKAMRLIETIEEDEDVTAVYHNIEMTEELAGLYDSENEPKP